MFTSNVFVFHSFSMGMQWNSSNLIIHFFGNMIVNNPIGMLTIIEFKIILLEEKCILHSLCCGVGCTTGGEKYGEDKMKSFSFPHSTHVSPICLVQQTRGSSEELQECNRKQMRCCDLKHRREWAQIQKQKI